MTRRILISYLAMTIAILAALEVPLAVNYRNRLQTELAAGLQRDAFAIASFSEETVEGTGHEDLQLLATNYANQSGARLVIVAADGTPLADSAPVREGENFASREEIAAALTGQTTTGVRRSDTLNTDLFYVAAPIAAAKVFGAVRITYSMDQLNAQVHRYWLNLAGVAAVSLLTASIIGIALARWVSRPLDRVGAAALTFGRGDLGARAPTDAGPPEVRRLAESFNATATRLQDLVTAQDQFVADASHQLRTPLAALRLRLENLQQENEAQQGLLAEVGAENDFIAQDLDAAHAETLRLARLVDGLLALARAERADASATAEPLYLAALLDERVSTWEATASERGVTIEVAPTDARVLATRDRLSQIVDNLVANALDVAPSGSTITLAAEPGPGAPDPAVGEDHHVVLLHIRDEGPGMSDSQREHAFDRFWRADNADPARATVLGGSGLGLSIVRKLARADGGDVELRAAPGGGLDAVIRLVRTP